jgi:hypothetical protein
MRVWRALKASGAAVLRDGVYVMPDREAYRSTLDEIAADVLACGGSAYVMHAEEPNTADFPALFDRTGEYATLLSDIAKVRGELAADTVPKLRKEIRKLRKQFADIAEIDFFPGEAQRQVDVALSDLELAAARALAPDEPQSVIGAIPKSKIDQFQGRTWATRSRPWVDRLASAWLIRRFIDPQARILWLASPGDCPPDALGFDFDGASFSHMDGHVTFEVLLMSFDLHQPGLNRLGALIHYLDVGGVQPAESVGIESVLAGMRNVITDNDQLLMAASGVFDGLLANFSKDTSHE